MKVLVAGATGAVGSRLVPLLVAAGHRVAGFTRSPAKAEALRQAGVQAMVVDAFDGSAVRSAVLETRPEVVVHEMTALTNANDLVHFDRAFATTNRLRTAEALDHLIAAAGESGARRFVAQSFCGWPYARTGGPVKAEDDPLDPDPPREMRRTLDAIRYLESSIVGSSRLEGVVLRYGAFYGPRSGLFDGPFVGQLRARRAPLIGDGGGWWSFLHLEDAASATARAVETDASGLYNIVDDEPAPVREWLSALAAVPHSRLGRPDRGRRASGRDDDREPRRLQPQGASDPRLAAGLRLLAAGFCGSGRVRRLSRWFGTPQLGAVTPFGLSQHRDQIEEIGQGFQLGESAATRVARQFGQPSPQRGDLILELRK